MEFVRYMRRDKDDAARLHQLGFVADVNLPVTADDVIYLVLIVRLLPIHTASGQHVQPQAHALMAQKFEIRPFRHNAI